LFSPIEKAIRTGKWGHFRLSPYFFPTSCLPPDNGSALHAFNATNMSELYNSAIGLTGNLADAAASTPTVFQGRVYVGTSGQVYVFGLCATGPNNACVQPH
jgi:outer membrane protein assembly factor BamB